MQGPESTRRKRAHVSGIDARWAGSWGRQVRQGGLGRPALATPRSTVVEWGFGWVVDENSSCGNESRRLAGGGQWGVAWAKTSAVVVLRGRDTENGSRSAGPANGLAAPHGTRHTHSGCGGAQNGNNGSRLWLGAEVGLLGAREGGRRHATSHVSNSGLEEPDGTSTATASGRSLAAAASVGWGCSCLCS